MFRNSFLIGRRPDTIHLYDTHDYWRKTVGDFITLPQYFKNQGFHTVSMGKVFHPGRSSGGTDDYPYSWSDKPYHPSTLAYRKDCYTSTEKFNNLYCPVNVKEQPEGTLPDLQIINQAQKFIENYSKEKSENYKPFFLAVGLHKPHIPFKFPKEYANLYPHIDLAPNRQIPKGMPDVAWNPWMDIRSRQDVEKLNISFPYGPIPDDFQEFIKKGYYASISYMDDLIGKLLSTLEENNFAENTMIMFVGDHGWSLGEHQEWAKYSNFENALRVPLLIYIPKVLETNGRIFEYIPLQDYIEGRKLKNETHLEKSMESDELVELVDILPTVCDIMELETPRICPQNSTSVKFCTEGISLKPLIENIIDQQKYINVKTISWKTAAFSQYPRPSQHPQKDSDQPDLNDIKVMGYTIKTKEYRYTEWIKFSPQTFSQDWSVVYAKELYNHTADPQENNNEANNPNYENIMKKLSEQLRNGWNSSLPSHNVY
ncbi:iduronate 2-sulfatase-like isoform X2 [Centruroides sculpturatus]|uniref:iduronate 2-sulfatase-like isoform X2 n=1 Tax=Centruroides sculpturatus TaxID=218467 RepID=UPI000C6D0307|nr:iduronate 2-sulfatase-like isoform X2 [Centruroides sculpturatus]